MAPRSDTLTLESLLEYEPFVRKVLRNMMVDEDQLSDLVQETWIRVLKRPPTERSGVRGWLATVARNLARDQRRTRSHRREREEAAARPEALDGAQASHERLEMHQSLVQAVLQLREPYKTVVVMRYYDGLSNAEIAQRVGRSEATVRSQIHRAHNQLKTQLDRQYGDRRAWMVIGVPWILSKEGAASLGVPGATKSLGSFGFLLGLLVGTLVMVALWAPWSQDQAHAGGVEATGLDEPQSPLAEAIELESLWNPQGDSPHPFRAAVAAPTTHPDPEGWTLPVKVTLDGLPVEGASVWAYQPLVRKNEGFVSRAAHADLVRLQKVPAQLIEMGRQRSHVVQTDARGEASVPSTKANVFLFAQHGRGMGVQTVMNVPERSQDATPLVISLDSRSSVSAEVLGPQGRPASGLPVELLMAKEPGAWQVIDCQPTDSEGLVHFLGFRHVVGDHAFALRTQIVGAPNPLIEVPKDGSNEPIQLQAIAFGSLAWSLHGYDPEWVWRNSTYLRAKGTQESTWRHFERAQGIWPCVALDQQFELRIESIEAGVHATWEGPGPVRQGTTTLAIVQEQRGSRVRGRLIQRTDHAGEVLPAYRFEYRLQLLDSEKRVVSEVGCLPERDGHFELTLPWAEPNSGPWHAEIISRWATPTGNQRMRMSLPPKPWNRATEIDLGEIEVRHTTHSIRLKLVDETGEPLPGILVQASPDRAGPPIQARTTHEGTVFLDGVWSQEVEVHVPPGQAAYLEHPLVWRGQATATTLELERTGGLKGWVTFPNDGQTGELLCIGEGDHEGFQTRLPCESDGSYAVTGLRPGAYRIQLEAKHGTEATPAQRVYVFAGKVSDVGGWKIE